MKKLIIAIIAIIMTISTASAGVTGTMLTKQEVVNSIMEVNPVVNPAEIDKCYNVMRNGGLHTIYSSKVSIYCTKGEMTRMFAQ